MSDTGYYGSYADFTCPDRKAAPAFMNSDNIVGDPFTIEMDYSGNKRQAWIVNPFGFRMGVLNEKTASHACSKARVFGCPPGVSRSLS